jgi:alpha-mannosidase
MDEARNEEAIMQHHDAITGTSPQATADDYGGRLYSAMTASRRVLDKAYKRLTAKTESNEQIFCDTLNITECSITETSDRIAVTIYNPIARNFSQYIRVPIGSGDYDVYDPNGVKVEHKQVVPVSKAVTTIPERKSKSTNELVFRANLVPLGFVTYLLKKTTTQKS